MSFLSNIFSKSKENGPVVANLGTSNKLYFNKELKRWVEPGTEDEIRMEMEKLNAPPPKAIPATKTLEEHQVGQISAADVLCQPPTFHSIGSRMRTSSGRPKIPSLLPTIRPPTTLVIQKQEEYPEITERALEHEMNRSLSAEKTQKMSQVFLERQSSHNKNKEKVSKGTSKNPYETDDVPIESKARQYNGLNSQLQSQLSQSYTSDLGNNLSEEKNATTTASRFFTSRKDQPCKAGETAYKSMDIKQIVGFGESIKQTAADGECFVPQLPGSQQLPRGYAPYEAQLEYTAQKYEETNRTTGLQGEVTTQHPHHRLQDKQKSPYQPQSLDQQMVQLHISSNHSNPAEKQQVVNSHVQISSGDDANKSPPTTQQYRASTNTLTASKSVNVASVKTQAGLVEPTPQVVDSEGEVNPLVGFCTSRISDIGPVEEPSSLPTHPLPNYEPTFGLEKRIDLRTEAPIEETNLTNEPSEAKLNQQPPSQPIKILKPPSLESAVTQPLTIDSSLFQSEGHFTRRKVSVESSLDKVSDRQDSMISQYSRRSTVGSQSSIEHLEVIGKLNEQLASKQELKELIKSVHNKLFNLKQHEDAVDQMYQVIQQTTKDISLLDETIERMQGSVNCYKDSIGDLAKKIESTIVPEPIEFATTASAGVTSLLTELNTWVKAIEEAIEKKVEQYKQHQEHDSECLTLIQHQIGVYEASIAGHRAALNEVLIDKANWKGQYECAEKVICDLYETAKRIDDSWNHTLRSHMQALKFNYEQRLEETEREFHKKTDYFNLVEKDNKKLKELNKEFEEKRDITIKRLETIIEEQYKMIIQKETKYNEVVQKREEERKINEMKMLQLHNELATIKTEETLLRTELNELTTEKEALEAAIEKTRKDVENMKRIKAEVENKLRDHLVSQEGQISTLTAERDEMELKYRQTEINNGSLKRETEDLKRCCNALQLQYESICTEHNQSRVTLQALEGLRTEDHNTFNAAIDDVQRQLKMLENENYDLKQKIEARQHSMQSMEETQKESRTNFEIQLAQLKTELSRLVSERDTAVKEKNELLSDRNTLQREKEDLAAKVGVLASNGAALSSERDTFIQELNSLKEKNNSLMKDHENLLSECDKAKRQLAQIDSETSMRRDLATTLEEEFSLERAQFNSKIERLSKEFSAVLEENLNLKALKGSQQVELSVCRQKPLNFRESENSQAEEKSFSKLEARIFELQTHAATLEKENEALKASNLQDEHLETEISNNENAALKLLQQQFEDERVLWTAEKDIMEQEIVSLRSTLHEATTAANTVPTPPFSAEKVGKSTLDKQSLTVLRAENQKIKGELEVVQQRHRDAFYALDIMSQKWDLLMNEHPRVAQKIDARMPFILQELPPVD